jgi:hypothetical protein
MLIHLEIIPEKQWLKTLMPLILLILHLFIPRFLETWSSFALLIHMPCSTYGFLQGFGVIILNLIAIERV